MILYENMEIRPSIQFIKKYIGEGSIGAEIGVYQGINASVIYAVLRPSKLYLIDLWDFPGDEETGPCTIDDLDQTIHNVGKRPEIEFMKMSFERAAKFITDESLDWVYIDSSHTYEEVLKDIKLWMPKVRVSGVIAGHDIKAVGVKKALIEMGFEIVVSSENVNKLQTLLICMKDDWWFVKGSTKTS